MRNPPFQALLVICCIGMMLCGSSALAQIGPGACCLTDGTCVRVAPSTCTVLGGEFMGAGTYCSEINCPQPTGACCYPDGTCTVGTAASCSASGGAWSGAGVSCAAAQCVQPTGACCFSDGSCAVMTSLQCTAGDGVWSGANVSCAAAPCPQPTGACCFPDGSCSMVSSATCTAMGGAWAGAGVSCITAPCPQPTGACCFPDGGCAEMKASVCLESGGAWNGEGSACAEVQCPEPQGACCLPDGSCASMEAERCGEFGGTWMGQLSFCAEQSCEQPSGACCFEDGSCALLTQSACTADGGYAWRQGIACADRHCPQPMPIVACCLSDGTCVMLDADACVKAGGEVGAPESSCDVIDCRGLPRDPPPLPDLPPRRASAGIKGSMLIIPSYDVRWNRDGHLLRETFVSLTNDYPDTVDVLLYFVNGDEPLFNSDGTLRHPGWNFVDNQIRLTANEPTWWSVATGLPKGMSPISVLDPGAGGGHPPGRVDPESPDETMLRGFIVAVAVAPEGHLIRWNHLSAVVTTVDYMRKSAFEYAALSFPVVDPTIAHGAQVGTPGDVRMDGDAYAFGYELLLMNFQAAGSSAFTGAEMVTSNSRLIVMPLGLDLRFGVQEPARTYLKIDVWNENEVKFSGMGRCVTCWNSSLLSAYGVPNHFLVTNLQTDVGKARMSGITSAACAGSEAASIAGVTVRYLEIESRGGATTASLLTGMGMQEARILFDPLLPPPEAPSAPGRSVGETASSPLLTGNPGGR